MTLEEADVAERHRSDISASVAQLHKLAPEIEDGMIERLVRTAYDELTPAKVHGYVPLLIVHQVRNVIRHLPSR